MCSLLYSKRKNEKIREDSRPARPTWGIQGMDFRSWCSCPREIFGKESGQEVRRVDGSNFWREIALESEFSQEGVFLFECGIAGSKGNEYYLSPKIASDSKNRVVNMSFACSVSQVIQPHTYDSNSLIDKSSLIAFEGFILRTGGAKKKIQR